ncbi:MAG TPA: anti-sigma factor [Solirubrobacterales bacterium]|nr:anti-sigma factor [Solirubrobacterales bacterium]
MSGSDHDRWSDDLAAYMLGALEPGEVAEFERHAEGCEHCRTEMLWLTPAVQGLPEAVERVEPPPRLRARVMAEARSDARRSGAVTAFGEGGLGHRAAAWLRNLGSGPMGLRPVVGFAAAVLVVAAVAGFALGGGLGGSGSGTSASTVAAGHPPGVTAKVIREGDRGTLRLADVKKLPENRILEAWVRRDGEVEAVPELFVPDRKGSASTTIDDMRDVDLVMVTTEPAGGSAAPTSSPIVSVPIPQ